MKISSLLTPILSIVIFLIFLEVVFYFLPVSSVTRLKDLSSSSKSFDVSSLENKEFTFSSNYNFLNSTKRKTNNLGFFSDIDYYDKSEIVAVIGDSYIEAVALEFNDTYQNLISKKLTHDTYNFSISGAPLSQYEAYYDEVCERYKIKKVIFNIVNNDFKESFYHKRIRDGFFHYHLESNELKPTIDKKNIVERLIRKSSLIRYIYFNLGYSKIFNHQKENSNQELIIDNEIEKKAINLFLNRVKKYCLEPNNIIFVLDADRQKIYGEKVDNHQSNNFNYFAATANNQGFKVLNLKKVFEEDFLKNKIKFNFEFDYHWNSYAHRLISSELISSGYLN